MQAPGFELLYEEGPCLAVCKPPGVSTQAPPGIDSLEVRVKAFLKHRDGQAGEPYLAVPHRLDRPASGVLVLATERKAARRLSAQFERRRMQKTYWAVLEGRLEPAEGTWRDYMRKIPAVAQAELIAADHPEARLAVLHYRRLAAGPWGSWLEIVLETGRTHQIRVQAAARGHPVLGDRLYGAASDFGPAVEDERLRAIALHARQLGFRDPTTRQDVIVTAPLPDEWLALGIGEGQ